MLKVLNNHTKCAEIYCNALIEPQFSIICICGKSMLDYDEFSQHFYSDHLEAAKDTKNIKDHQQTVETTGKECLEEPMLVLPKSSASPTLAESEYDTLTTATSSVDVNWSETSNQSKRRPYKPRNKPNMCTYCGRTFRRRYLLETHINIHTGRKPHQCEMCGKQFRAISTLSRHLRTHEQRQEQQCKHCEKLFTHRSALLSHEMRHTQIRRFACTSCDKCFYTRNQMDTHRRKLHANGADPIPPTHLPFACELCSNSYRSASMLSTHKLKKHYRMAKYRCEQCDKKFVDAERLQQHQLIHVKPEPLIK
ncbi:hypothetical protein ACLKA6_013056 [Drosophila palustris]